MIGNTTTPECRENFSGMLFVGKLTFSQYTVHMESTVSRKHTWKANSLRALDVQPLQTKFWGNDF